MQKEMTLFETWITKSACDSRKKLGLTTACIVLCLLKVAAREANQAIFEDSELKLDG